MKVNASISFLLPFLDHLTIKRQATDRSLIRKTAYGRPNSTWCASGTYALEYQFQPATPVRLVLGQWPATSDVSLFLWVRLDFFTVNNLNRYSRAFTFLASTFIPTFSSLYHTGMTTQDPIAHGVHPDHKRTTFSRRSPFDSGSGDGHGNNLFFGYRFSASPSITRTDISSLHGLNHPRHDNTQDPRSHDVHPA